MAVLSRSPYSTIVSIRLCAAAIALGPCCFGIAAQKPAEIDYSIHLEPAFSEPQAKFVREALLANDPTCQVWPDTPTQRVVVRTTVLLDRPALELHIAPAGLHVLSVDLLLPADPQERKAMIMASMGFPHYEDTGHPEQDVNNYETAKAAWIDADPARYERLMSALNPAVPTER